MLSLEFILGLRMEDTISFAEGEFREKPRGISA